MGVKDDGGWTELVRWMSKHAGFESRLEMREVAGAGRGLATASTIKAGATLLHIPSTTLLNPLTLSRSPSNTIPAHLFPRATRRVSPANTAKRIKPSSPITPTANGIDHLRQVLDTTQLLTLHLLLSRDAERRHVSDWAEYLDTLPRSFRPWHPLTWLVPAGQPTQSVGKAKGKGNAKEKEVVTIEWWAQLALRGLSPGVREKLDDVKNRFDQDHSVLLEVLRDEEPFRSQKLAEALTTDDIPWAWLNAEADHIVVNTRSVSLPLGLPPPSQRNNHTLVPMLDYINHSSNPSCITSEIRQTSSSSTSSTSKSSTRPRSSAARRAPSYNGDGDHLIPGRIDFIFSAPSQGVERGKEVLFQYGSHSSATLFAEYGFVERPLVPDSEGRGGGGGEERWLDLQYGEVDLGYLVDELWEDMDPDPDPDRAEVKKGVLEALGCWRRSTIHAQPAPPHPAHSLLMTLRLLHLSPEDSARLSSIKQGLVTYISSSNESAVMDTLAQLCRRVIKESEERTVWLKGLETASTDQQDAVGLLLGLCQEESVLARAVLKRIEAGEDLS